MAGSTVFNTFWCFGHCYRELWTKRSSWFQSDSECFWRCICINILFYVLLAYVEKRKVRWTVHAEEVNQEENLNITVPNLLLFLSALSDSVIIWSYTTYNPFS